MGDARLETLHETAPNTAVSLHPQWSAAAEQHLLASAHRAAGGRLYTYRWGTFAAHRLPLHFVPAEVRALLHAWWRERARLLFTLDGSAARSHAVCHIANDGAPLGLRVGPLSGHWAGVLELEAVDGRLRLGLPFILDHPQQGRLDQPQLSLL